MAARLQPACKPPPGGRNEGGSLCIRSCRYRGGSGSSPNSASPGERSPGDRGLGERGLGERGHGADKGDRLRRAAPTLFALCLLLGAAAQAQVESVGTDAGRLPQWAIQGLPSPADPAWGTKIPFSEPLPHGQSRRGSGAGTAGGNSHDDADPRYSQYDLDHVQLRMSLDIANQRIEGAATFRLRSLRSGLSEILLDLVDTLAVTRVTWDEVQVPYGHADRQLHLFPSPPLRAGEEATFTVEYQGYPIRDGFMGLQFDFHRDAQAGYPDPQPLVSTLSETNSAPAWWPCKDVTYDKFTLDAYYTVPDTLTAAGNGVLVEVIPAPNGRRIFHWREDHPIATYLVSLAATNYVTWADTYVSPLSGRRMPVVYYCYPESEQKARAAWARTPQILAFFATLFGEYPFVGEKYGMAEFNWGGAMENQTLTSYGTYQLNYDPVSNERLVAHEMAHQWWGDLVTPATWNDIWLNEGFAVFSEALWYEHLGGHDAYIDHLRSRDSYPWPQDFPGPIVPPEYPFGPTVYHKGAWVLHMLRGLLGDEAFFRSVREYRKDFAHGVVATEDFRAVLERYSARDLQAFFRSWVYGTGRPDYHMAWSRRGVRGDAPGDTVDITLRQIQPDPVFAMPVPIQFILTDSSSEFRIAPDTLRVQGFTFALSRPVARVVLDPEDWILKHVSSSPHPGPDPETPLAGKQAGLNEGPSRWILSSPWPNPSSGRVRLRMNPPGAPGPTPELWVADAAGRLVTRLAPLPEAGAGGIAFVWDGRRDSGGAAPSGVYWVTGEGPFAPRARRIVRVR